jgi:hypothetical protein
VQHTRELRAPARWPSLCGRFYTEPDRRTPYRTTQGQRLSVVSGDGARFHMEPGLRSLIAAVDAGGGANMALAVMRAHPDAGRVQEYGLKLLYILSFGPGRAVRATVFFSPPPPHTLPHPPAALSVGVHLNGQLAPW